MILCCSLLCALDKPNALAGLRAVSWRAGSSPWGHLVQLRYGGGFDEEPSFRLPEECACPTQRLICCCREGDVSALGWDSFAELLAGCLKLWKPYIGVGERDAPCSFPGLLHLSQPKGLKQRWKPSVRGIMCSVGTLFIRNRKQPLSWTANRLESKNRFRQNANPEACQAVGLAASLHYLLPLDRDAWPEVLTHICNLPFL